MARSSQDGISETGANQDHGRTASDLSDHHQFGRQHSDVVSSGSSLFEYPRGLSTFLGGQI
jgi:hypothetical protein